jgi:hypothetical protein
MPTPRRSECEITSCSAGAHTVDGVLVKVVPSGLSEAYCEPVHSVERRSPILPPVGSGCVSCAQPSTSSLAVVCTGVPATIGWRVSFHAP